MLNIFVHRSQSFALKYLLVEKKKPITPTLDEFNHTTTRPALYCNPTPVDYTEVSLPLLMIDIVNLLFIEKI